MSALGQAVITALILALILTVLVVLFMIRSKRYNSHPGAQSHDVSVQVLVLGDIGRSPRMQYHALSIAKHGGRVSLIGYHESAPHPDISSSPRIITHPLSPPPAILRTKSIPFIITGPLKVLWQIHTLIYVLGFETTPSQWLLVQNPPSIPTLAVALVISRLRNTRLLIDWHNYGWTILAGTRGSSHPFVKMSKLYECLIGRWAPDANLTVTDAMARQLKNLPYGVTSPILTLHDRPANIFQPIKDPAARAAFLGRLEGVSEQTGSIMQGTTRLIVSSTSWTPDEDFSILLDALVQYASYPSAVPTIAVITGKGPQKSFYEKRVKNLQKEGKLPNITIQTKWLALEDYATLLACADLGICLHMSSSGVDLPMKVVDMFGTGLPVAAYSRYESCGELVKEGVNGCGFETSQELAAVLGRLLALKTGDGELKHLRRGATEEGNSRWDEAWDGVVGRLLGLVKS
ncbi:glycosyltransferase family 33 protein [Zalerion maritima]|uniref:Chitobiosyldiphosphodolichol beta-mannosyltransferase n=1 Tax=Zalerion maritima TaxID=339359 RepID=A0AAD5S0D5_9PEZI|nr:glycosyltransferase family 33 protein [Zalerion maritima]